MKIAVFGAGGVGGYFGARLAEGGADVSLSARGAHLAALREGGLRLRSPKGDASLHLPATDRPGDIGPVDVVLFCVKSTDTEASARSLAPLLGPETVVVTLQNGVDNEEKIEAAVGPGHVAGGVAYIMATIAEPGVIVDEGELARIVFGELDGRRSERLASLLDLCRRSHVDAELSGDIQAELWRKFVFICAIAGMTASVRLPVGAIRRSEPSMSFLKRLAREVFEVAVASGVSLPAETPDSVVAAVHALPENIYSSLHYDLTHGKPMELEALHGTAIRRARESGISVPGCEAVYAVLHPWALRNG